MCKHVAAALYGVGARLDDEPEIFFMLRQVDQAELISAASSAQGLGAPSGSRRAKTVASADLSALFGIELDAETKPAAAAATRAPKKRKPAARRPPARQAVAAKDANLMPRRPPHSRGRSSRRKARS